MDFTNIKKLPYMSKRMYVLQNLCSTRDIDLEYLFGLFNLYNKKNSGRWFWQKASFTGGLKKAFDSLNRTVDDIIKKMKNTDKTGFDDMIRDSADSLEKLVVGMELNCGVNRDDDPGYVRSFLDNNLRSLIEYNLKPIRQDKAG